MINKRALLILIVILILTSLPALKSLAIPEFYTNHDGVTHTARIANFYLALKEGQIPPRLAPNLFGKLGFPIFIFIYPLPYLLGSFFHTIGFSFTDSFEIVIALSFVLSAITMFIFTREIFGNLSGFLAALFYSWAPYRFSQIYVRAAIAESFAYIFIPLVLLCLLKLSGNDKRKNLWLGLGSLSLSGLLLSHQLVSFMFLPVIAIFTIIFLLKSNHKKIFFQRSIALGLLGFFISAYIYFPALFERKFLRFDQLISYYTDHFVTLSQLIHSPWSYGFSMPGVENDDMSFQVGLTQISAVCLASFLLAISLIGKKFKNKDYLTNSIALSSLLIFLFSLGLMLKNPLTKWIWSNISLVTIVDFPWRWLGVSVFAASILAAWLYYRTRNIFLYAILIFFVFYANRNHLRINKTAVWNDEYFLNYMETATWMNEFLPRGRQTNRWEHLERDYRSLDDNLKVQVNGSATHDLKLTANSDAGGTLEINRLYFPGWKVTIDGKSMDFGDQLNITKEVQVATQNTPQIDRSGLLRINVPAGNHQIEAIFTETPIRKLGMLLSQLGLFISLVLIVPWKKISLKINRKTKR